MKVFNLLKYLSPRHQCDLICLGVEDVAMRVQLQAALPHLGSVRLLRGPARLAQWVGAIWAVLRLKPPSFARFSSPEIHSLLAQVQGGGKYDVIHYDIINMAKYHSADSATASVHSPNDATSQVYFRRAHVAAHLPLKARLIFSALLLRRFERKAYANFSKIHVVSEGDQRYLSRIAPAADVAVIPISSGYPYAWRDRPVPKGSKGEFPCLTVCGNLGDVAIASGFSNFMVSVLPRLLVRFPNLRVRILGRKIPAALLERIRACPNVEYHAWIENFENFLSEADVILIPDMAGAPGAKTRVVQAMALGLAVVGSETAFEGIPVKNGFSGMVYSSFEECLGMLLSLLGNAPQRQRLGAAAAGLAAEEYSLERIGPKYEALYHAAAARHVSQMQNRP